jgi:ADP-ribose pyrophosphatase
MGDAKSRNYTLKDVEILNTEVAYSGFFQLKKFLLRHRLLQTGEWSKPILRECFMRPEAVAVLPYDPYEDAVILIEQFRVGSLKQLTGPWQIELVAGIVKTEEKLEEVAVREAYEETGCAVMDLEYVASYLSSPGGSSEKITLYCGGIDSRGLGGVHGLYEEEGEDIWVQVYSREEALNFLSEGYISNASAIIGLQWLQMNYLRLRDKWR